jgi:CO/xanthine dehydrogenase FAD-binding subunit
MQYHRPHHLKEAIALLKVGQPLGGGTALTPARRQIESVIDLQDLNLDEISVDPPQIRFGAGVRLQQILDSQEGLPPAFLEAIRGETAWNMRNAATLGGLIVSADGRSPVLTALTAMEAKLEIEPGGKKADLHSFLALRADSSRSRLLTRITLIQPEALAYARVARSPMDRPIVCASAARRPDGAIILALGGYGEYPVPLPMMKGTVELEAAGAAAARAYADAGDGFASGEYRSAVAAVLVKRVVKEVLS